MYDFLGEKKNVLRTVLVDLVHTVRINEDWRLQPLKNDTKAP